MELISWITHKYVMHGFLWFLHKDHHELPKQGFFEWNDFFFLIFAVPGSSFIIYGSENFSFLFYIGIGITLYGLAYFLVHEIFIHQRIKIFRKTKNKYLHAIRQAHKIHHKKQTKEEGEHFGMLYVSISFLKRINKI
tara:strand:- start:55561 stop:55971 length:411 start_codon:yes stop_codon:yes gene_type:complete